MENARLPSSFFQPKTRPTNGPAVLSQQAGTLFGGGRKRPLPFQHMSSGSKGKIPRSNDFNLQFNANKYIELSANSRISATYRVDRSSLADLGMHEILFTHNKHFSFRSSKSFLQGPRSRSVVFKTLSGLNKELLENKAAYPDAYSVMQAWSFCGLQQSPDPNPSDRKEMVVNVHVGKRAKVPNYWIDSNDTGPLLEGMRLWLVIKQRPNESKTFYIEPWAGYTSPSIGEDIHGQFYIGVVQRNNGGFYQRHHTRVKDTRIKTIVQRFLNISQHSDDCNDGQNINDLKVQIPKIEIMVRV